MGIKNEDGGGRNFDLESKHAFFMHIKCFSKIKKCKVGLQMQEVELDSHL